MDDDPWYSSKPCVLLISRSPSAHHSHRHGRILRVGGQRDDPSLRGLPDAVGGSPERGVVAAASYEARRFGVHSAMTSVTARRQCPDLVFVPPRFDVYKAGSHQIHAIFARGVLHGSRSKAQQP